MAVVRPHNQCAEFPCSPWIDFIAYGELVDGIYVEHTGNVLESINCLLIDKITQDDIDMRRADGLVRFVHAGHQLVDHAENGADGKNAGGYT